MAEKFRIQISVRGSGDIGWDLRTAEEIPPGSGRRPLVARYLSEEEALADKEFCERHADSHAPDLAMVMEIRRKLEAEPKHRYFRLGTD
jgi:hypothetical protein